MKKNHIIPVFLAAMLIIVNGAKAQKTNTNTNTTTTTTTTTSTSDSTTTNVPDSAAQTPAAPAAAPAEGKEPTDYYKFYLGVRFMPTFTKFDIKTVENGVAETSFVLGYGVGGYFGYNFSKNVGMQVEMMYSVLSQKYTQNNVTRRVDLSYLNIPLLLVLNTDVSKPVNLNFCVGPQLGINLGSKVEAEGSNGVDTVQAVIAVKPADIGFAYGAGLDFRLSPSLSLGIGFRGVYGILDISENTKTNTTNQYYILDRAHVKTYSGYAGLALIF